MERIEPVLIERAEGLGWLALTPDDYPRSFGAEGQTEAEARAKFAKTLASWEAIRSDRPVKQGSD